MRGVFFSKNHPNLDGFLMVRLFDEIRTFFERKTGDVSHCIKNF